MRNVAAAAPIRSERFQYLYALNVVIVSNRKILIVKSFGLSR